MKTLIKSISLISFVTLFSIQSFAYLTASPSMVNFGQVSAKNYSYNTRSVTIFNQSDKAVTVDVSAICPMEFRVQSSCYGQIYPNSTCSINVIYTPNNPGYHSCNITLRSSDYSTGYVSVSGSAY